MREAEDTDDFGPVDHQAEVTVDDAAMLAALVDRLGAKEVARLAHAVEDAHKAGLRLDREAAAFVTKRTKGRPRRCMRRLLVGWRVAVVEIMATSGAPIRRTDVAAQMMRRARQGDLVMRWSLGLPLHGRFVTIHLHTLENLTRRLPLAG